MQHYITINRSSRLVDIANLVGDRNLDYVLAANDLVRAANIGVQFQKKCQDILSEQQGQTVSWQRKSAILNRMTQDSDVFETAALLNETGWKILSALGTFPNMLLVPESITLPNRVDVLGNGLAVVKTVYDQAISGLETPPHYIDPSIFNEFSTTRVNNIVDFGMSSTPTNPWQAFNIPWGDITIYSSLSDSSLDIPVYPEEVQDTRKANYTTMPDLLYTYEPWYLYQSSGPRSNQYTFKMHRDMWSGDHSDGKANELIRFCQACCYPKFNGSAVNSGTVTLYVKGETLISGIMEDVSVSWDGPILQDGWYAHFELQLSITEISNKALNYDVVKAMPLIG